MTAATLEQSTDWPAAPPTIRVGITEAHGMAHEQSQFPPEGVEYVELERRPRSPWRLIRSPIKGYLDSYDTAGCDLVEAVISPAVTELPWVYSTACFQESAAFSFLGLPLPMSLRTAYLERLLLRDNCRRLLFWSHAGLETLRSYGRVTSERWFEKCDVVHPAIRRVPDERICYSDANGERPDDRVEILFSGTFFIKGGVHVVDAFELAQREFPGIHLRLCCDEAIDFKTSDTELRRDYLRRIHDNPAITLGRVPRETMIREVLPATDVYALPTYADAFGFALLEAMAFGIPSIATNYFAIPEMIESGLSGLLIDTAEFDCPRLFRGCRVDRLPRDFHDYLTAAVHEQLVRLIESAQLRREIGGLALETARTRFSFETRNARLADIYRDAVR